MCKAVKNKQILVSRTSGAQIRLLLQGLVLTPQKAQLADQLALLLCTMDEDVGGYWITHTVQYVQSVRH